MAPYTPRDWLLLFGMATMALGWFVSFRIVREPADDSAEIIRG